MMSKLNLIYKDIRTVEEVVCSLETRVTKPFGIIDREKVRSFRYARPELIHYVILNTANAVHLLHSIILLLKSGFQSPAFVLMRGVLEADSKLSYVIGGLKTGTLDKKSRSFLDDYFSDNTRVDSERPPYRAISQKDIHRRNSESVTSDIENLERFGMRRSFDNKDHKYAALQSSLYRTFSNYVHGRYPEAMSVFGEKSKNLCFEGNLESKDLDGDVELAFVGELVDRTANNLRISLMYMQAVRMISLTPAEKKFALTGIFSA